MASKSMGRGLKSARGTSGVTGRMPTGMKGGMKNMVRVGKIRGKGGSGRGIKGC